MRKDPVMVLRIAGLPVWGPSDVIAGARAALGWTDEAVTVVAALPERVSGLLNAVEGLIARIDGVATRVEALLTRAEGLVGGVEDVVVRVGTAADDAEAVVVHAGAIADGAAGLIGKAEEVAERAGALVTSVGATSTSAQELLEAFQPMAQRAAPLAHQFIEEFSETEVLALIRLIDQVPVFTEHMESDIMPILATLDRVGPDVHELLEVLKDVRLAIEGIPGFRLLRRRADERG